jgi:hypothetical protein
MTQIHLISGNSISWEVLLYSETAVHSQNNSGSLLCHWRLLQSAFHFRIACVPSCELQEKQVTFSVTPWASLSFPEKGVLCHSTQAASVLIINLPLGWWVRWDFFVLDLRGHPNKFANIVISFWEWLIHLCGYLGSFVLSFITSVITENRKRAILIPFCTKMYWQEASVSSELAHLFSLCPWYWKNPDSCFEWKKSLSSGISCGRKSLRRERLDFLLMNQVLLK